MVYLSSAAIRIAEHKKRMLRLIASLGAAWMVTQFSFVQDKSCSVPRSLAFAQFSNHPDAASRRQFMITTLAPLSVVASGSPSVKVWASEAKRRNLPAEEMAAIVREDLEKRQFLATADFTPEIYDQSCTFTDEIDSYTYEKFVKGTKALFVGSESNVRLVGDVQVLDGGKRLQFRFDEILAFNFPIIHPKVSLTGLCTLTRGDDGLIVAYKEKWDQSVSEVLLTARL